MRDICSNRHRGSPTSVEAYHGGEGQHSRQRAWVLRQALAAGWEGVTVDELSAAATANLGREIPPNRISGRVSELKVSGDLVETGRRRRTRAGKLAAVLCAAQVLRMRQQTLFGEPTHVVRENR